MKRRRLLQLAGLGAGSLLLPSLRPSRLRAAPAASNPRLVAAYGYHGMVLDRWEMLGGRPRGERWNYTLGDLSEAQFSDSLRPLWRHRNKVTIVGGLEHGTPPISTPGNGHGAGFVCGFTGMECASGGGGDAGDPKVASVDQVIADALRASNPALTDLVSQQFTTGGTHAMSISTASGQPRYLPMHSTPRAALDAILEDFTPGGGGTPDPLLVAQADVLQSVAPLYDSISGRISAEDRIKLEAHRDMVRDVASRLTQLDVSACQAPGTVYQGNDFTERNRSFWDVATMSLSCGVSRVVTMAWPELDFSDITEGAPPQDGASGIHAMAHRSVNSGDDQAQRILTRHYAYYLSQIAELADRLDAVPDENGTLLDNTMIVFGTDISDGNHGWGHGVWAFVVVGGGNFLNAGRYYNEPGTPHNKAWVSIANAMGVNTNTIGNSTWQGTNLTGAIAGLVR